MSPGGATLTSLAMVGKVREYLRDVEDALTLAAAEDDSVPLHTYAAALGMTTTHLRRRIENLQAREAGGDLGFIVGYTDDGPVRLCPGSNMHVRNYDGGMPEGDIAALVERLRDQASAHSFMTSPPCEVARVDVAATLQSVGEEFDGRRGVFVLTGAHEDDVRLVLDRMQEGEHWRGVTMVWIDTRPSSEGIDVTIEAAFDVVIRPVPHEEGGAYLVTGTEASGAHISLGA